MANARKYDIEFRTSSTDADPSALQGDLYWYNTNETENGEKVFKDNATSEYAYWNNGTYWFITEAADVGDLGLKYFVKKDFPETVEVVGAGDAGRNGTYNFTGLQWQDSIQGYGKTPATFDIFAVVSGFNPTTISHWRLGGYEVAVNDLHYPPKTGWYSIGGTLPAPTLEYDEITFDMVSPEVYSGTITDSAVVIADAWKRAEDTAFESLRNFTGCVENNDCYRGFLPVEGDDDDYDLANVWMMTSGNSEEMDMERLMAGSNLWCSLRSDARIDSIWEDRCDALKFAGVVEAWLKETNNLNETGNVAYCSLAEMPAEPEIYRTDGRIRKRYWLQTINLELVYQTETVFD